MFKKWNLSKFNNTNQAENVSIVSGEYTTPKSLSFFGFRVHWFDLLICSAWIFGLVFLGVAMSGATGATAKYLDSLAGLGAPIKTEILGNAAKTATKIFLGDVKVNAQLATLNLQLVQLTFDKLVQIAIVAFVKALLTLVLNFIKQALNKLKQAASQIGALFNISGPAKKLMQILGGRVNLCDEVEKYVGKIFSTGNYNSTLELAMGETYNQKSALSMVTSPVEFFAGVKGVVKYATENVKVEALSILGGSDSIIGGSAASLPGNNLPSRTNTVAQDADYLSRNLQSVSKKDDRCNLSIFSKADKAKRSTTNSEIIATGLTAIGDYAATGECDTKSQCADLKFGVTKALVNGTQLTREAPSGLTSNEFSVFGSLGGGIFSDYSANFAIKNNTVEAFAQKAAEGAKKRTDNVKPDVVLATQDGCPSAKDAGSVTVPTTSGCETAPISKSLGNLSPAGQKLALDFKDPAYGNSTNGTSFSIANGVSVAKFSDVISDNAILSRIGTAGIDPENSFSYQNADGSFTIGAAPAANLAPVGIAPIPASVVAAQTTQAITQQSSASSGGGESLADAVIALLNQFLQELFNALIDTLFGFINNIIGSFCSNFAIESVCDSLTSTSKKWETNLRRDAKNVRIASGRYNTYAEGVNSEGSKVINTTENRGGNDTQTRVPQLIDVPDTFSVDKIG